MGFSVGIVGLPNVGKSTLFNRIAGRQKAIVIDEPGATRDRNYMDCLWHDRAFTLIDTGGFEPATEERILVQMREQTNLAIEEADVIIFLMDGRDGLTPTDVEIARQLRGRGKKVFYAANKVDGARHEELLPEYYRLGIDALYPLSAQHGLGVDELLATVTQDFPAATEPAPDEHEPIAVAIVGKPNVGKSSLLNALADQRKLARVSQAPGKTRLVVYFDVDSAFYIADLPGYGFAKAPKDVREKFSKLVDQYFSSGRPISLVLHLIDIRHSPSREDIAMLEYMNRQSIPYYVVFTKCDKLSKAGLDKRLNEIAQELLIKDMSLCFAVSAEKKEGLKDLKEAVTEYLFPGASCI